MKRTTGRVTGCDIVKDLEVKRIASPPRAAGREAIKAVPSFEEISKVTGAQGNEWAPTERGAAGVSLLSVLSRQLRPGATTRRAEKISAAAERAFMRTVMLRRQLHQYPELSGEEDQTAALVASQLKELGLAVETNVGGHGVVAVLRGEQPGPTIAYRADMDALPQSIDEKSTYRSTRDNVSHACGHDAHTSIAVGIAEVLSSMKADLCGTVKFLFQPAEEKLTGAASMIADGALKDPAPEAIFALHVYPFETGKVVMGPDVGFPGCDFFEIEVMGDAPRATADLLMEKIRALDTLCIDYKTELKKKWQPLCAALFDEGSNFLSDFIMPFVFRGNGSSDQKQILRGFFKAADEAGYRRGHRLLEALTSQHNTTCRFTEFLPEVASDPQLVDHAHQVLGEGAQIAHHHVPFHGEDFAHYLEQIPGLFVLLGAGADAVLHDPSFQIDESALLHGVRAMSSVLFDYGSRSR